MTIHQYLDHYTYYAIRIREHILQVTQKVPEKIFKLQFSVVESPKVSINLHDSYGVHTPGKRGLRYSYSVNNPITTTPDQGWAPGSPVQLEPEIRKTRAVFPGSTGKFPGGSG